jgi:hypothetical protein
MSMNHEASAISTLLQAQWSLSSPSASQILWAITRVDSALFLASSQSVAIGIYNPASPTTVIPMCREAWQEIERVQVDILVKVGSFTPAATTVTREAAKLEVYRILHLFQLKISGILDVYIERELNKIEGQDLVRITLQVACVNFHVQT